MLFRSQSLKEQAATLSQVVGAFKLAAPQGSAAAPIKPAARPAALPMLTQAVAPVRASSHKPKTVESRPAPVRAIPAPAPRTAAAAVPATAATTAPGDDWESF